MFKQLVQGVWPAPGQLHDLHPCCKETVQIRRPGEGTSELSGPQSLLLSRSPITLATANTVDILCYLSLHLQRSALSHLIFSSSNLTLAHSIYSTLVHNVEFEL